MFGNLAVIETLYKYTHTHSHTCTWVDRASSSQLQQCCHWRRMQMPMFQLLCWPTSLPCYGQTSYGWKSLPWSRGLGYYTWWKIRGQKGLLKKIQMCDIYLPKKRKKIYNFQSASVSILDSDNMSGYRCLSIILHIQIVVILGLHNMALCKCMNMRT